MQSTPCFAQTETQTVSCLSPFTSTIASNTTRQRCSSSLLHFITSSSFFSSNLVFHHKEQRRKRTNYRIPTHTLTQNQLLGSSQFTQFKKQRFVSSKQKAALHSEGNEMNIQSSAATAAAAASSSSAASSSAGGSRHELEL